jgi:hypothetical protein
VEFLEKRKVMARNVVADQNVGLVQIRDCFVDLVGPVAFVFPCVDVRDPNAVYLSRGGYEAVGFAIIE